MKKKLKRILYVLLAGILLFVILYAWPRVPIITAFAAKGMCSSVFLAGKQPERVRSEDLSFFPISLARTRVNQEEKSVTATVVGVARRKAVFREGLGAVIVLDTPEQELMAASLDIPDPGYSQDTLPWPLGDVLQDSYPAGVDRAGLESAVAGAFDNPGTKPRKKTLAVVVVYKGMLVAEKYLEGYDEHTCFQAWSMTKSLGNAVVGILDGEGRIDVKAPVDIPEWKEDDRAGITLEDLLHMNTGLHWRENYFNLSEVTKMLMQTDNVFEFTCSMPLEFEPGSHWKYSGGDANLVSGLLRQEIGDDRQYHLLPYTGLLHRIGMLHTRMETDAAGNFVLSSYCYGSARDWARLGLLYLNEGIFAGDTILTQDWVDFTRQEAPNSNGKYAAFFWLRELNPFNALKDLPEDVYFADGFLGQRVYIIPSDHLVVVRMGYGLKKFSLNDFLHDILIALPD